MLVCHNSNIKKTSIDYKIFGKKIVPLSLYDPLNPKHIVITFDGGYEEMMTEGVPLLQEYNYPYVIFVIGNYIGKDNSFDTVEPLENFLSVSQLQKVVMCGRHLQWHTNSHPHISDIKSQNQWIEELTIPEWIKLIDVKGFTHFAYSC